MFLSIPNKQSSGHSINSEMSSSINSQFTINSYKHSYSSLLSQSKEQLRNIRKMENGFYVRILHQRFLAIDRVMFILIVVNASLILAYTELQMKLIRPVLHTQITYVQESFNETISFLQAQRFSQFLLWLNLGLTFITIPISFIRHSFQCHYQNVQKKPTYSFNQLIQLLFIVVQPYPFCNKVYVSLPLEQTRSYPPIQVKLNLILVILSIVKSLLVFRYILFHDICKSLEVKSEKFFTPSYNRICKIYTCDNNYLHVLRCLFKQNFIVFIGGFYLLCMITCAYCLRIIESHFDGRFMNILNCMWFTLMSMTTVGYGDLFVSTPIGVILDGILMFSGVVIVSLLVSSLNGLFTLGYRQRRSLGVLKRLKDKCELKQLASSYIAVCLTRKWRQRKWGIKQNISQQQRVYCRRLNRLRMDIKCRLQKQVNIYRDMSSQFESLKLQLQEVRQIYERNIHEMGQKQRLQMNMEQRKEGMRNNRSSSYCNMIRMKSREERVSLLERGLEGDGEMEKGWRDGNKVKGWKDDKGERKNKDCTYRSKEAIPITREMKIMSIDSYQQHDPSEIFN